LQIFALPGQIERWLLCGYEFFDVSSL